MDKEATKQKLLAVYHSLDANYGPQHWWPADGPFEVMVGAILTQQTAWRNVERAIANLKSEANLTPLLLRRLSLSQLAGLVYPCGFYRVKSQRLKTLAAWLERFEDNLERLFSQETIALRKALLALPGIGEETADSILLYAAHKPIFVIDAYTRRILQRLGLAPSGNSYAAYQAFFMEHLSEDAALFNQFHALFVQHGKETCGKVPRCSACCLRGLCAYAARIKGD